MPREIAKLILLVEDNEDDVDLTLRAFKAQQKTRPFEVAVARDGAEALDFLLGTESTVEDPSAKESTLPSLVLLDINLPKLNGLEVLKLMRADERTKSIPVVMFTTSDDAGDMAISYAAGANSYVRKPVSSKQFAEGTRRTADYWLWLNSSPLSCRWPDSTRQLNAKESLPPPPKSREPSSIAVHWGVRALGKTQGQHLRFQYRNMVEKPRKGRRQADI
ncbi:MAG: response regulator [Trueperaceae bacterium]